MKISIEATTSLTPAVSADVEVTQCYLVCGEFSTANSTITKCVTHGKRAAGDFIQNHAGGGVGLGWG